MAKGRKLRRSEMQGGQELLPGIPNQITIQNIAPKMTWEAQNVMQLVSREWRYALHSRSVYDARVLSKYTEAFLVMVSYRQPGRRIMLLLYSCKHGTCLELPPVPVANSIQDDEVECICLDGRIYLWAPGKNPNWSSVSWTEIWMLDLAGDRRWTMCRRGECYSAIDKEIKYNGTSNFIKDFSERLFRNGVLDGKIYRYRGSTRPTDVSVLEVHNTHDFHPEKSIRLKVKGLPETEVYDPQSNLLSVITPKPLRDVDVAPRANLKSHFDSFRKWERERLQTGPPTIKCYEPFYSEWRARLSTTFVGEKECCSRSAMAPQVYHKTLLAEMETEGGTKHFFFIGEKLVKLVDLGLDYDDVDFDQTTHGGRRESVDLQVYNIQKDAWEHWKSFPDPCDGCGAKEDCGVRITYADCEDILSCVFADGVIWILVTECPLLSVKDPPANVALKKSLPFLGKETDAHATAWIDTECSMDLFLTESSVLRPIYL